jgi:hypothetical protein
MKDFREILENDLASFVASEKEALCSPLCLPTRATPVRLASAPTFTSSSVFQLAFEFAFDFAPALAAFALAFIFTPSAVSSFRALNESTHLLGL